MKVYVAECQYEYEPGIIVGVFSSRELAEKFLDESKYKNVGDYREVTEFTLDKEV